MFRHAVFAVLSFASFDCAWAQTAPPLPPPDMSASEDSVASVSSRVNKLAPFRLGPHTVALEETALVDMQRAAGGDIGQRGDASSAQSWLCYSIDPDARLWLMTSELSGPAISSIVIVKQEVVVASPGCPRLPAEFQPIGSINGLTLGDVRSHADTRFGPTGDGGWVHYQGCEDVAVKNTPYRRCADVRVQFDRDRIVRIEADQATAN
jgi:hypothetical protein